MLGRVTRLGLSRIILLDYSFEKETFAAKVERLLSRRQGND